MDLADLTWPAVAALPRTTPVVFPVAALEQHGRHMPVFTDSLLLGEVVRRVKLAPVAAKCLFAPLTWLGNSHHHLDFPGTLSASPRVYLDLLKDLANNVIAHGFSRVVFVNGHGGNTGPLQQALFELRQDHRSTRDLLLLSLTYWDAAGSPAGLIPGLVQTQMGHACEWETSMVLRLRPELVTGLVAGVPEVPFGTGFAPGYRGWVMPDRSEPGHIGTPAAATVEKGEALFAHFAGGVSSFLAGVVNWERGWDSGRDEG
ncbi:MAG TPA: creatininase family protein [Urbifossiella sp.]|jgi:creatinine amidohydrolase|nr:creatininase family protein [Urbifossiella sp.]